MSEKQKNIFNLVFNILIKDGFLALKNEELNLIEFGFKHKGHPYHSRVVVKPELIFTQIKIIDVNTNDISECKVLEFANSENCKYGPISVMFQDNCLISKGGLGYRDYDPTHDMLYENIKRTIQFSYESKLRFDEYLKQQKQ